MRRQFVEAMAAVRENNEKIDGQGALCYIRKENDFISD